MGDQFRLFAATLVAFGAWPSLAQDASLPAPAVQAPVQRAARVILAGTPIVLTVQETLSSRTHKVGDRFAVLVESDVLLDGLVAIPAGTPGYGEITFSKDNGAFGRPGMLGIAVRGLDLSGKPIVLDGRYREEGANKDSAAAATMFAVGLFAAFVRGSSAVIPQGRSLKGRIGEEVALSPVKAEPPAVPPIAALTPAAPMGATAAGSGTTAVEPRPGTKQTGTKQIF